MTRWQDEALSSCHLVILSSYRSFIHASFFQPTSPAAGQRPDAWRSLRTDCAGLFDGVWRLAAAQLCAWRCLYDRRICRLWRADGAGTEDGAAGPSRADHSADAAGGNASVRGVRRRDRVVRLPAATWRAANRPAD